MLKKSWLIKDAILTSSTPVTIASLSVAENIDKAIVAVSNGLAVGTDTVTAQVFVQFVPDGSFWEIAQFVLTDNVSATKFNAIPPGGGAWGLIADYGFRAIKVTAFRTGTNPVPVGVEINCLANGEG